MLQSRRGPWRDGSGGASSFADAFWRPPMGRTETHDRNRAIAARSAALDHAADILLLVLTEAGQWKLGLPGPMVDCRF